MGPLWYNVMYITEHNLIRNIVLFLTNNQGQSAF